jgi:uncharacterized protein (DUF1330 family)
MPKAYLVVTYRSVNNREAWRAYSKLAGPAMAAAGGRRGGNQGGIKLPYLVQRR